MNKMTLVPGYRLFFSPSMKLKNKDNHYLTPCSIAKNEQAPAKM